MIAASEINQSARFVSFKINGSLAVFITKRMAGQGEQ
jgi:hypothetical protein